MRHPDPFCSGKLSPVAFSRFEMLLGPEAMEQKAALQHVEMQKLACENQRLAATHATLRHELVATQRELEILHAQIGAVKSESEQQMRELVDKITYMEAELKKSEPIKSELQKSHAQAQISVVARHELICKVHQLDQDLQKAHKDVQQIPALMSELDFLKKEYQHFRNTHHYEKKLYDDQLESLQVMEKNYISMSMEIKKLRGEVAHSSNVDTQTCGPFAGMIGENKKEATTHTVGQNSYQDAYGVPQGHVSFPLASGAVGNTGPISNSLTGYDPQSASIYDYQTRHVSNSLTGPGYNNASNATSYNVAATGGTMPH